MPLNKNIKKVLVIGSGPIVIGQAAEFDYSGTQACRALKEENIEVVLINSNPATIMTDREVADAIYIEPLNIEFLEKIIKKEKPDSILVGMGGQTGLNLAIELYEKNILQKYGVNVIGTSIESIKKGEDRELFKELMQKINQPIIQSGIAQNQKEAIEIANEIDYPVILRPAYTLGGTGGGVAENEEDLILKIKNALKLSPVNQVLIEKSIKGWKEIEYEVIRDNKGNCITVCNMENIDPVGIHTGDSIVVAPVQTLSDKENQMLRKASIDIINAIEIEGGCNVQLALDPKSFDYVVIEINPRVSRSSALASKATGYPIAKVATKIALGFNLDEIKNEVTQKTYACFEPALDYVVTKIPKWPFDKFTKANKDLGTKMMATGEVMAIGRNFESSFLKAIRSLEINQFTLKREKLEKLSLKELKDYIQKPDDERIFAIAQMISRLYSIDMISQITGIDKFFLYKIKNIIDKEEELIQNGKNYINKDSLLEIKKLGFSDKGIAQLINVEVDEIYNIRKLYNILPSYKMVDTCSGEFDAVSPYYYSVYGQEDEVKEDENAVIVIGSGPIRIGQGIEFDYCSVKAVQALKKQGIKTIIINNNPETVSTDFDISDKLYFEPLTQEDVFNIVEKEKPIGVILQFGGQTAIKLAKFLNEKGVNILGTSFNSIDKAEDREKFENMLEKLNINRPKGFAVNNIEEGLEKAKELKYPILVRPSYVLGGAGMEITYNDEEMKLYLKQAFERDSKNPVLIDKYLTGTEIEVDAICDKKDVLLPGIMQHLERAGVHSGDSMTIYPSKKLTKKIKDKVLDYTRKIAKELQVSGVMNIQFIEHEEELYIIEVNPRASRTIPYISKITNIPIIELATRISLGENLEDIGYKYGIQEESSFTAIKAPIFSTEKLPLVEVSLGPEMRSTGEVLGIGKNLDEALYKSFMASKNFIQKKSGKILVTLKDDDKKEFYEIAKSFNKLGYEFIATQGTSNYLKSRGINCICVEKLNNNSQILELVELGEIDFIINTPTKGNDSKRDGFKIRRAAIERGINVYTSIDTVRALIRVIENNFNEDSCEIYNLNEIN